MEFYKDGKGIITDIDTDEGETYTTPFTYTIKGDKVSATYVTGIKENGEEEISILNGVFDKNQIAFTQDRTEFYKDEESHFGDGKSNKVTKAIQYLIYKR